MLIRMAVTVAAIGVIGWSVYQYDQSEELGSKLQQAERLHANCMAEKKAAGQPVHACREWAYVQVGGSGSDRTRKRIGELASAAAAQGARECRQELESRRDELRRLEAELRGLDGSLVFRSDADATRHASLRGRVEAVGLDCQAIDGGLARYARASG